MIEFFDVICRHFCMISCSSISNPFEWSSKLLTQHFPVWCLFLCTTTDIFPPGSSQRGETGWRKDKKKKPKEDSWMNAAAFQTLSAHRTCREGSKSAGRKGWSVLFKNTNCVILSVLLRKGRSVTCALSSVSSTQICWSVSTTVSGGLNCVSLICSAPNFLAFYLTPPP